MVVLIEYKKTKQLLYNANRQIKRLKEKLEKFKYKIKIMMITIIVMMMNQLKHISKKLLKNQDLVQLY